MISKKLLHFMDNAKTIAWIVFYCLAILIIIFPFVGFALALEAMFNQTPLNIYLGLILICVIYLALFLLAKLLIKIYPWWRSRKKIPRILIVVTSLVLIVVITAISILIPQKRNYIKTTNHFEANWDFTLPEDIKLKYSKFRSFGFVGGHDELAYAVFKLDSNSLDNRLSELTSNTICNLTSYNQAEINQYKNKFPVLSDSAYAKLYFEKLTKAFPMQIPKRFLPNWDSPDIQWGLHGAYIANYNQKATDACLFIIFEPNTKRLVFYEFLVADH